MIEDPTDFKPGFSKIYKQTFDCAETEVGDSDTATWGFSWFGDRSNDGWGFSNCAGKNEMICSMNIPVLGQWCQFIKKKDSASFCFFFF